MTTVKAVEDGRHKITNELLGGFNRKVADLLRRIDEGTLDYWRVMNQLQLVIEDRVPTTNHGDPFVPVGWKVEKHQKSGDLKLTREGDDLFLGGKKITFHLSPNQMGDKSIKGENLRGELAKEMVLNANVLDYLLAHPDLIPDSWKVDSEGRTVLLFFWGTVYRRSDGVLCVRDLCWNGSRWGWSNHWLGREWSVNCPAAVLAS